MAVTIELSSDVEANLEARAQAEGLPLARYVQQVLEREMLPNAYKTLTPEERAEAWRRAAKDLPPTPTLSDYAMSREGIYSDRE